MGYATSCTAISVWDAFGRTLTTRKKLQHNRTHSIDRVGDMHAWLDIMYNDDGQNNIQHPTSNRFK